jgi:hypothetical protein
MQPNFRGMINLIWDQNYIYGHPFKYTVLSSVSLINNNKYYIQFRHYTKLQFSILVVFMKMQVNMGQPHYGAVFVSYFTCVIS